MLCFPFQRGKKIVRGEHFWAFWSLGIHLHFASEAEAAPDPDVHLIFVQFQLFGENYTESRNFFPWIPRLCKHTHFILNNSTRDTHWESMLMLFYSKLYFGQTLHKAGFRALITRGPITSYEPLCKYTWLHIMETMHLRFPSHYFIPPCWSLWSCMKPRNRNLAWLGFAFVVTDL